MINLEELRALFENNAVEFTQHFLYRIEDRNISVLSIRNAVANGEIIEHYPNDYPYPSVLIFGYTNAKKPLHVVVGVGGGSAWLVTAYYPSLLKWERDLKTRKAAIS
jgi:hypothetical protein